MNPSVSRIRITSPEEVEIDKQETFKKLEEGDVIVYSLNSDHKKRLDAHRIEFAKERLAIVKDTRNSCIQHVIALIDLTDEQIDKIRFDSDQSLRERSVKSDDIESIKLVYRPSLYSFINLGPTVSDFQIKKP